MDPGSLPATFVRNVCGAFPQGEHWLQRLPETLDTCLKQWKLALAGDAFDLSYHYVVPVVTADGSSAVLKLGVPSQEIAAEADSLLAFAGAGAVHLLDHDPAAGALLLERITPGFTLATLHDEVEATAIAAQIMLALWRAPLHRAAFPSLDRWTNGLERLRARYAGATGPLDAELVDRAEAMRADLLRTAGRPCLLHADLHHFNILKAGESRWVAIDPKGVVGDPAYEPASFLLNPDSAIIRDVSTQRTRIITFANRLEVDAQRITAWAFVHAVLAAWWTVEDGATDYESPLQAARVFRSLLT